jgi:hypothetical protein
VDLNALPKNVRRFYASIEFIGRPIEAERVDGGWRLSMASDRVHVTIDFATNRLGKTDWSGSTLTVDGKERPLANNPCHLKEIFDNPDGTRDLGPLPEHHDPDGHEVPHSIRKDFAYIAEALTDKATVVLGHPRGEEWVIAIEAPDTQVRIAFIAEVQRTRLKMRQKIDVVQNGVDRSHEVGDDLANLIGLMMPTSAPKSPETPVGRTAGSARSNSVETRRATVIRN